MPTVLVGTDGSGGAGSALRWAAGAAKALGAELVVATVAPAGTDQPGLDETRRLLETTWCAPARLLGEPFRTLLVQGDPREMLPSISESEGADLTVLGTAGAGWFPALHLGSVGHHLAQHTTRPLAIIPQDTGPFSADRVVVGVDGSPGSLAALEWCCRFGEGLQPSVTVVYAHTTGALAGRITEGSEWRELAERECRQWAGPLEHVGRLAGIDIVELDPAKALIEAVASHDADLVVVGTRGGGGFHGLRLGSVALRLLHHSNLPTVLVPPQAG